MFKEKACLKRSMTGFGFVAEVSGDDIPGWQPGSRVGA